VTIEHEYSLPTFRVRPEQLAPVAAPHVHEPHVRSSLAPVYQVAVTAPTGHGCALSNIVHRGAVTRGTHSCPGHPPPIKGVAQNRLVFTQAIGASVGVPEGTHAPPSDSTNALACTP
jgi:hypothetical protein